ncbi:pumilio homolog 11-like [Syzygium oleosum]|uniref:pumilio homolog 11-like n=1 Tax=Syzygium oleosum TaxID=219896 RepID=UPI0024BAE1B8|nr:pumilio homolog 11-like [Syzygium oleosum]
MEHATDDRSFGATAFAAPARSVFAGLGFPDPGTSSRNPPPLGSHCDAQSLEDGFRSLRLSPPNRQSPHSGFAGDVLGAYPRASPTDVSGVGVSRTDGYDVSRQSADSIGSGQNIFRFNYGPSVNVKSLSNHSPALLGNGWIQTDPNVFAMAGSRERLSVENLPFLPALGGAGSCNYNSRFSRPNVSNSRLFEAHRTPVSSAAMHNLRRNVLLSTRNGSRSLLRTREPLDKEKVARIFDQVIDRVGDFMIHQTWNHVIQNLVEVCNEEQRTRILEKVTLQEPLLVRICLDSYGIHAVKKLLDHVTTPYQMALVVSALLPGVVSLALERNGVIEHCLQNFPHEYTEPLLVVMANNCYDIATNQNGCCTLQACINYSDGASREHLLAELTSYSLQLAQDEYGFVSALVVFGLSFHECEGSSNICFFLCFSNYVVQSLLSLMMPGVTNKVLEVLRGSFLPLSTNKYASHVVEKCFNTLEEAQSRHIALELTTSSSCPKLFTNKFGNYVAQKLLEVAHQVRSGAQFYSSNLLSFLIMHANA